MGLPSAEDRSGAPGGVAAALGQAVLENQPPPLTRFRRRRSARAPRHRDRVPQAVTPKLRVTDTVCRSATTGAREEEAPGEVLEAARKKAAARALAMKEDLAGCAGRRGPCRLKDISRARVVFGPPKPGGGVGAGVGPDKGLGIPTRSLITPMPGGPAEGIQHSRLQTRYRWAAVSRGRATTMYEGVEGRPEVEEVGGGGGTMKRGRQRQGVALDRGNQAGLERNKGAIYAIYQPRDARGSEPPAGQDRARPEDRAQPESTPM